MTTGAVPDAVLGRIGRYELVRRLGAGGMGEVFLARASGAAGFETEVCIKRILPHLAGKSDFVRRFIDEGKLVSRLRHAGIAQVLDLGEDQGTVFLAMEYIDGHDLRDLMRLAKAANTPPSPELLVWILCRILDALDYAHRQTVIHRDVSPSNVMVGRTGNVKLVDFGLARAADRLSLSQSGAIQGKFSYMSPEQAAGKSLDARSDQFSVGVMAWELFAGARPFDGKSDLDTLERIRKETAPELHETAPGVPPEVAEGVAKLLAKRPGDRFEDAEAARKAFASYLATRGATPGARDLADWVAQVEEALPKAATGTGLSLDSALELGLAAGGLGSVTRTAPAPDEVAAKLEGGTPESSEPAHVNDPSVAPANPVPVQLDTVDSGPISTSTPSVMVQRTSRAAMVLLVVFNVLLLAAVGVLLYRLGLSDEPPGPTERPEAGRATDRAAVSPVGPVLDVVTGQPDAAASPSDAAESSDTKSVTTSTAPDATPTVPLQSPAGSVLGSALAGLSPPAAPATRPEATPQGGRVKVSLTVSPKDATVAIRGYGSTIGPRTVVVPRGTTVRATISAKGYETKSVRVRADRDKTQTVKLVANAFGWVTFRFFPANASVSIDGKPLPTAGRNLVKRKLSVGKHRVTLSNGTARRTLPFEVKAERVTNLKTVRLNTP